MTELASYLGDLRFLQVDAVLAGIFEDERPPQGVAGIIDWYLFGQFTELLLSGRFGGRRGEGALIATQGRIRAPKFVVVGLGPRQAMGAGPLAEVAAEVVERLSHLRAETAAVELVGLVGTPLKPQDSARALASSFRGARVELPRRVLLVSEDEVSQEAAQRILR